MAKLRMEEVDDMQRQPERRDSTEASLQNAIYDGRKRFKAGKTAPIIFRTTPEKRAKILEIADALGLGKGRPVSMTQVIERGIDALERELKGKGEI